MNKIYFILFITQLFFSSYLEAIEKGKWSFKKEDNWCYIGSIPTKEEGEYSKRGDVYILVYRMNKNPDMIIQINAGYNYDEGKAVELRIDNDKFELFGQGDSAWSSNEDSKIIKAMIKGLNMTIIGFSSRGTLTTDTYNLNGFTAAHEKLKSDC